MNKNLKLDRRWWSSETWIGLPFIGVPTLRSSKGRGRVANCRKVSRSKLASSDVLLRKNFYPRPGSKQRSCKFIRLPIRLPPLLVCPNLLTQTPDSQLFEGATEPLWPGWPQRTNPTHPDPIWTPFLTRFRPEFDPILTRNCPKRSELGQQAVGKYGRTVVRVYPAECGEQLGRGPLKIGSSKSLVLKSFWVERTFWDSSLPVSFTHWDTPALLTPPLPLPQVKFRSQSGQKSGISKPVVWGTCGLHSGFPWFSSIPWFPWFPRIQHSTPCL